MPQRAKVPCKHTGCPALIRPPARFCESHERTSPQRRAPWAQNDGRSASSRGYGAPWRKIRARQLAAKPLCRECLSKGRTVSATTVDHIKPKSKGGGDEPANLQSLCRACHYSKTATDRFYGRE